MSKGMRTEDEVRDSAKLVLGFDKEEPGVQQGTGQITTFNQLGFRGCNDKPDGWYLPDDASKPAIILETKSEAEGVSKEKHVKELFKNIDVVAKKYSKTIGILYSGSAIRVFRNKIELSDASKHLENKDYYIRLCTSQKLDSNYIFEITQKINNSLHFKFGMTDLQDRMIFTACALVAQRFHSQQGLKQLKGMSFEMFKKWILDTDEEGKHPLLISGSLNDYPVTSLKSLLKSLTTTIDQYEQPQHPKAQKDAAHINKHAMHIVRLYYTAFDILEKGEIITHRDKEREELLAIRNGKYLREDGSYAPEFFEFVDALEKRFQDDVRKTPLPAKPDFGKFEELLVEINKSYLRRIV